MLGGSLSGPKSGSGGSVLSATNLTNEKLDIIAKRLGVSDTDNVYTLLAPAAAAKPIWCWKSSTGVTAAVADAARQSHDRPEIRSPGPVRRIVVAYSGRL